MNTTRHIAMTAAERATGRYMRAPDHPTEAGAGTAPVPAEPAADADANTLPAVEAPAPEGEVSAEDLEKEFGQDDTPATEGDDGKPAEEAPAGEGDKPKSDVQTRIDELTAARREAERKAAEADRDAEYWRGMVKGNKEAPAPDAPSDADPEPSPQNYDFGEADAKFIADTARWAARQESRTLHQQAEVKAELATMESKWNTNVAATLERLPDFNEKVIESANRQEWKCPPVVALGIKNSEFGPDIAYHLATNKDVSDRIAGLSTLEQALELGRLEGRFQAEAAQRAAPTAKKVTSAPPPPAGQSRGAGGKFSVAADTDDFSAFERSADALMSKS